MPGFCLSGALALGPKPVFKDGLGRAPFHPILEAVGSLDTNPQAQLDSGTGVGFDLIIALVDEL